MTLVPSPLPIWLAVDFNNLKHHVKLMQQAIDTRIFQTKLASVGLEPVPHLLEPHRDRIDVPEPVFAIRSIRAIAPSGSKTGGGIIAEQK